MARQKSQHKTLFQKRAVSLIVPQYQPERIACTARNTPKATSKKPRIRTGVFGFVDYFRKALANVAPNPLVKFHAAAVRKAHVARTPITMGKTATMRTGRTPASRPPAMSTSSSLIR